MFGGGYLIDVPRIANKMAVFSSLFGLDYIAEFFEFLYVLLRFTLGPFQAIGQPLNAKVKVIGATEHKSEQAERFRGYSRISYDLI